jgi:DHA1 family tetracycline resistance protein-like MFS transporter
MRKSSLLIIFLVIFLDLVGFGVVIPILPYYAKSYGASAWQLGWLMTTYSLAQFIFGPFWERLSDSIGRKPVLLVSVLGSCASMTLLGFAGSLKWLFIGRILAGVFGANISTAYAYVSDVTTEENRAAGMGIVGAGFGLGFIFGPAIGGILSRYGYDFPMFAGAILAGLNFLFALIRLEEPNLNREAREANRIKRFDLANFKLSFGDRRARIAILLFFLLTFAVAQMESIFAYYMANRFSYDAQAAGFVLAIMGIVMIGVQGGMIGRLSKKYGEVKLITLGFAICAVSLAAFASMNIVMPAVVALCVLAFGHGIVHPSLSSLTSKGTAAGRRGATMGVFQSAGSLARIVGPPTAGWLYDHVAAGAPFFNGSIVLGFAFLLAMLALGA